MTSQTNLVQKPEIFNEKFTADTTVRITTGNQDRPSTKFPPAAVVYLNNPDGAPGLTFIPAESKAYVTLDTGIRVLRSLGSFMCASV